MKNVNCILSANSDLNPIDKNREIFSFIEKYFLSFVYSSFWIIPPKI